MRPIPSSFAIPVMGCNIRTALLTNDPPEFEASDGKGAVIRSDHSARWPSLGQKDQAFKRACGPEPSKAGCIGWHPKREFGAGQESSQAPGYWGFKANEAVGFQRIRRTDSSATYAPRTRPRGRSVRICRDRTNLCGCWSPGSEVGEESPRHPQVRSVNLASVHASIMWT